MHKPKKQLSLPQSARILFFCKVFRCRYRYRYRNRIAGTGDPDIESRYRVQIPIRILVAVFCLLFAAFGCRESRPAAAPPPMPAVSGVRALELTAAQVAIGPRHSGSPGASAAAAAIVGHCHAAGLQARVDEWREPTPAGEIAFRNVVAELPGPLPGRIILGSHYDTKLLPQYPGFAGANDAGSSTGLLLALAEVLAMPGAWQGCTLEFVFFDGEECLRSYRPNDGLHGSRRHAAAIRQAGRVAEYRAMILLDMVGDRELGITMPQSSDPRLARSVLEIAAARGWQDKFGYFLDGDILDDHVPFQELGIPCLNLIDFSYGHDNSFWHTDRDSLENISAESLETVGAMVLELLWRVAY